MYFDRRKSGIPSVDVLYWGSHFCQFYQSKEDLLDILVPYFRAGLEYNELCVWVIPEILDEEDVMKALWQGVSGFGACLERGQIELVPYNIWKRHGEESGNAIVSRVDKAVSSGFDGVRLACDSLPGKGRGKAFSSDDADVISRHNVMALFTYPRDKFDASGLMEVVRNHRFALVRNAGRWEVIESSEARTVKDVLKRSEERLQSLFSNMSEGFAYHRIVLDPQGKPCDFIFLEVTRAFERITGLKRENIIGKRVTEVLPGIEKDPTDWIGKYGRVAMSGEPMQFESYAKLLGRWYSVSAFSPHRGFFAVTVSDITERKQAEESLSRAKEEWELTFDSVPDMIAILDNHHRIIRVNEPMARRLGLKAEECEGLSCYNCVHEASGPPAFCPHSRTIADGGAHFEEVHEDRLGGDFLVTTTPLRDKQGLMIGSVHVAHDITERKKAERRIVALNDELKRKLNELSEANKELEAFSYSVSHDLRAPLRSINGFSQEILEDYADKLDENGVDSLRRIRAASQRMGVLIDGLLGLSRVARSEVVLGMVDLSALANDIIRNLRIAQPEPEVEAVVAEGLADQGDERLIYVLLQNLLGNAWKFSVKARKPRVEFGSVLMEGKTTYFARDNGAGFDMAYVDKLFKPFQRLHGAADFPGTGIGLATVNRIVRRHGGKVWAEGKVGEGATFYFTLH